MAQGSWRAPGAGTSLQTVNPLPPPTSLNPALVARSQTAALTSWPQAVPVTSASLEAWRRHVQDLTEVEKKLFSAYSDDDIKKYMQSVENDCRVRQSESRVFKIASAVRPLMRAIGNYMPIAAAASQADPYPTSIVLGGIMAVIQMSDGYVTYQDNVSKWLFKMGKKAEFISQLDALFYQGDNPVQRALVDVYVDILNFCREALKLLVNDKGKKKHEIVNFGRSLVESFDSRFGPLVEKFNDDFEIFRNATEIYDKLEARDFQDLMVESSRQNAMGINMIAMTMMNQAEQRRIEQFWRRREQELRERELKRSLMIQWLPSISFQDEHAKRDGERLEGTGEWLLESSDYKDWKSNDDSDFLWVKGKAGCGKSILAAVAVNDLELSMSLDTAVAYVYCSVLDALESDPSQLLGSILRQLCVQTPNLDRVLEEIFDRKAQLQSKGPVWEQMKKILPSLVSNFTQTYILVDGLDECLENSKFAQLLRSLADQTPSTVKVVIFSRPEKTALETALSGCTTIPVDSGLNTHDITTFIASILSDDDLDLDDEPEFLQVVKDTLLRKAEGMFLWVSLMAQTLKGPLTQTQVIEKVASIPTGLDEVYQVHLKRILEQKSTQRELALKILLWIANATRPLTRNELLEALSVQPQMENLSSTDMLKKDRGFPALCADLVLVDKQGCYQLLHASLKEYLLSLKLSAPPELEDYRQKQSNADKIIGETCLTYLLFDKFKTGPASTTSQLEELKKDNPFFHYATTKWGQHITAETEGALHDLINKFVNCESVRGLTFQILLSDEEKVCPYPSGSNPLHLLAMFGLLQTAKSLSEVESLKYKLDGFGRYPLDYALASGSRPMCLWLVEGEHPETGMNILQGTYSPMHTAAVNEWEDLLKALIRQGYNVNYKAGKYERTALADASSYGSLLAATALIEAGADVNLAEKDGDTPLILAVEFGNPKIAQLLVAKGADLNAQGRDGITALHIAAQMGDTDKIKLFLDSGAEIGLPAKGPHDQTAIHLAAGKDHPEIIEMLHEKGAGCDVRDVDGVTPLQIAAYFGSLAAAKQLISFDVNLKTRDNFGRSLLHTAAWGHAEFVRFLIGKASDVNALDDDLNSPLHHAAESGNLTICRILLEHEAKVDHPNFNEHTALFRATDEGHSEVAQLLVDHGADVTRTAVLGSPPLHYAANRGFKDFIKIFIDAKADPEAQNDDKYTALHFAARLGKVEFVRELFAAVPNLNPVPQDKWGKTPLHAAASGGYDETVQFLVQRQAAVQPDLDKNLPLHCAIWSGYEEVAKHLCTEDTKDTKGLHGRSPLCIAATRGYISLVEFLLEQKAATDTPDELGSSPALVALMNGHVEVANLLLDRGADPKFVNADGTTMLHAATRVEDSATVERLLKAGCDGLLKNAWGYNSFWQAVESSKMDFVKKILDAGFNGSNIPSTNGTTCIHSAASNGSLEMLDFLVANGGDPLAIDATGCSALHYAARSGRVPVFDRLLELGVDINGGDAESSTPLAFASFLGYTKVVDRMLELNADTEKDFSKIFVNTPMMLSVVGRVPKIVEKLIAFGSDPFQVDELGFKALDYAALHPPTFQATGVAKDDYKPADRTSREKILKNTARRCIEELLAQTRPLTPTAQDGRIDFITSLSTCLMHLGGSSNLEAAKLGYSEQAYGGPRYALYRRNFECSLCLDVVWRNDMYVCTQCGVNSFLCEDCHTNYQDGANGPKSISLEAKTIAELEKEVWKIREIAQVLFSMGASIVRHVFNMFGALKEWVSEKLLEYEAWEEKYNSEQKFKSMKRPGQEFLKMIAEIDRLWESADGDVSSLDKKLEDFAESAIANRPFREFVCAEHEYMKISEEDWKATKKEGKLLDKDDRIRDEWIRDLFKVVDDAPTDCSGQIPDVQLVVSDHQTGLKASSTSSALDVESEALFHEKWEEIRAKQEQDEREREMERLARAKQDEEQASRVTDSLNPMRMGLEGRRTKLMGLVVPQTSLGVVRQGSLDHGLADAATSASNTVDDDEPANITTEPTPIAEPTASTVQSIGAEVKDATERDNLTARLLFEGSDGGHFALKHSSTFPAVMHSHDPQPAMLTRRSTAPSMLQGSMTMSLSINHKPTASSFPEEKTEGLRGEEQEDGSQQTSSTEGGATADADGPGRDEAVELAINATDENGSLMVIALKLTDIIVPGSMLAFISEKLEEGTLAEWSLEIQSSQYSRTWIE